MTRTGNGSRRTRGDRWGEKNAKHRHCKKVQTPELVPLTITHHHPYLSNLPQPSPSFPLNAPFTHNPPQEIHHTTPAHPPPTTKKRTPRPTIHQTPHPIPSPLPTALLNQFPPFSNPTPPPTHLPSNPSPIQPIPIPIPTSTPPRSRTTPSQTAATTMRPARIGRPQCVLGDVRDSLRAHTGPALSWSEWARGGEWARRRRGGGRGGACGGEFRCGSGLRGYKFGLAGICSRRRSDRGPSAAESRPRSRLWDWSFLQFNVGDLPEFFLPGPVRLRSYPLS